MPMSDQTVHPCGIVGDHVGRCEDCGAEDVELGSAHVCRPCWESFIEFGLNEAATIDRAETASGQTGHEPDDNGRSGDPS